jgi:cytochrome c-type biogenesis protein CcmH
LFWIFASAFVLLSALFVVYPLWKSGKSTESLNSAARKEANVALYHERKRELEEDLASEQIDQQQFDVLMLELQQSLLTDVSKEDGADKPQPVRVTSTLTLAIPLILVFAMPIAAYSLYQYWGFLDEVSLTDLYTRTVNNGGDADEAKKLIVELGQAAQRNGEQPWTLYFLAENFANVSMFNEASIAYQRAADLLEDSPDKALVLGRVALAKFILADFKITPEVLEVINQARDINPSEVSILQLLAVDAEQREDYSAAIEYWRLLIQVNPNSEQAQTLRQNIAAAQQILARDNPDLVGGASIDVSLSVADGLDLPENLRVFVAARNAAQEGMPPLAAVDLQVSDLPMVIRLDDLSAVGPFNLSSADTVYVSALVSYSGTAAPQSGDYRIVSQNFSPNGQNASIELVISEQVQ